MNDPATHFATAASGTPTGTGRYVDRTAITPVEILPGLSFQPVLGTDTLLNFVTYAPHSEAPLHTHEEEQVVLVLEGELHFQLNEHTRVMRPGDVAVVPAWVPHGAHTLDVPCVQVDFFNPPRQTLVAQADAAIAASSQLCG
ncbi:cupin domain-containing protein [Nocardioides carbamazepini]|uniref:cupin domain-containing protein n=1 Tax=Nocardioides carbamazepini TaxID=2854259 RepID=UPI002149AF72|nr:cupin domain-containing protein [Nocardioides carbamazepini]MCR1782380.1 cupin domain-containing protein [Nocardioides carbamazepini]